MVAVAHQKVWTAKDADETVLLSDMAHLPTKMLQVKTAGFSGTLDIKGSLDGVNYINARYCELTGDGGLAVVNDQLSFVLASTTRVFMLAEFWPHVQLVMTRSAGTITLDAWGHESSPFFFPEDALPVGAAVIGGVTIADGSDVAEGATTDAAVVTDANGTVSGKLRGVVKILADVWDSVSHFLKVQLQAGTAIVGKVGIDQTTPGTTNKVSIASQGYTSSATITRPNDAVPYTANDVVGAAAAAITFANVGRIGEMLITSVELEIDVTSIPAGMTSFDLHLYSVTPPSALADNAAWDLPAGDRASYLGKIVLGTPVDLGSTLYVEQNSNPGVNLPKQLTLASTSLFAYLVTVGAYTPSALAVKKITLHAVEV